MRNGTDLPPLCTIWAGNAHWMWQLGIEDQMPLLPPSSILTTPGEDKHCRQHHPTHIPLVKPSKFQMHCSARTPTQNQASPQRLLQSHCPPKTSPSDATLPSRRPIQSMPIPPAQWCDRQQSLLFLPLMITPTTQSASSPSPWQLPPPLAGTSPPPNNTSPSAPHTRAIQQRIALPATDEDCTQTPGQTECNNIAYNNLAKTANFPVADGFVIFTCTFCYLGSLINYSLYNNDNIIARIAAATASMGALKEIWWNPHLNFYNKYLLFWAILMNLLLWGAETWSLCKSQLDQLEVFLHRSIRWILHISISKVQEDRIWNKRVREMFHSIPCVRNMIVTINKLFLSFSLVKLWLAFS